MPVAATGIDEKVWSSKGGAQFARVSKKVCRSHDGKFYAVFKGRRPGVYLSWPDAEQQTVHFPNAVHQSFGTLKAATDWLKECEETE